VTKQIVAIVMKIWLRSLDLLIFACQV